MGEMVCEKPQGLNAGQEISRRCRNDMVLSLTNKDADGAAGGGGREAGR